MFMFEKLTVKRGSHCLIFPPQAGLPFPSSALPASGFMGIISARDIKAPLTVANISLGLVKKNCRLYNKLSRQDSTGF